VIALSSVRRPLAFGALRASWSSCDGPVFKNASIALASPLPASMWRTIGSTTAPSSKSARRASLFSVWPSFCKSMTVTARSPPRPRHPRPCCAAGYRARAASRPPGPRSYGGLAGHARHLGKSTGLPHKPGDDPTQGRAIARWRELAVLARPDDLGPECRAGDHGRTQHRHSRKVTLKVSKYEGSNARSAVP